MLETGESIRNAISAMDFCDVLISIKVFSISLIHLYHMLTFTMCFFNMMKLVTITHFGPSGDHQLSSLDISQ